MLWERIEPIIAELNPPKATGRRCADRGLMLDGIIFHLPRVLVEPAAEGAWERQYDPPHDAAVGGVGRV